MRRKDREILDGDRIDEIIRSCDCCRLGFADGLSCYLVPMNFGYVHRDGQRFFYFHGAREGRKLELTKKNGVAGFELDTGHGLKEGTAACQYSYRFQSIVGSGLIQVVNGGEEKREALRSIMEQYTGRSDWEFPVGAEASVTVLKLTVQELSCKEHV